jgi:hypothetical protein
VMYERALVSYVRKICGCVESASVSEGGIGSSGCPHVSGISPSIACEAPHLFVEPYPETQVSVADVVVIPLSAGGLTNSLIDALAELELVDAIEVRLFTGELGRDLASPASVRTMRTRIAWCRSSMGVS